MNSLRIAKTIHLAIAALCAAAGDAANPPWDQCPEPYQQGIVSGVEQHLAAPDTTPEQAHEAWVAARQAEGWIYGAEKNADAKTHPFIVPWADLPPNQRAKDYVFKAIVDALKDVPDVATAAEIHAGAAPLNPRTLIATPAGFIPVKYVGRRDSYIENTYGTKLRFEPGQQRLVPADKARLMLSHPDVWALGELQRAEAPPPEDDKAGKAQDVTEEKAQEQRDVIAVMDKNALVSFAKNNFRMDLDKRRSVDSLRAEVTRLVDQYGAPEA